MWYAEALNTDWFIIIQDISSLLEHNNVTYVPIPTRSAKQINLVSSWSTHLATRVFTSLWTENKLHYCNMSTIHILAINIKLRPKLS